MFNTNKRILPPRIIAFGNVLLDMSVKIEKTEILDRYGLTLDAQGEISSEILSRIIEELRRSRFNISSNAGGSALNTCRILKSLGGSNSLFFGSIGEDESSNVLKKILFENNIETCLQTVENCPTGQCICFVYKDRTALYANIGASIKFTVSFLESSEKQFLVPMEMNELQIFYIEGFFVTHREIVCKFIIEKYIREGDSLKLLALNLSAPYIVKENPEIIKFLVEHSTIIFGNKNEFLALAQITNYDSVEKVANYLITEKSRILIVTNGSEDIKLYRKSTENNIEVRNFNPIKVLEEEIVDTTGAGDSFVAGFLKSFVSGASLDECIEEGSRTASLVIKQVGCKI